MLLSFCGAAACIGFVAFLITGEETSEWHTGIFNLQCTLHSFLMLQKLWCEWVLCLKRTILKVVPRYNLAIHKHTSRSFRVRKKNGTVFVLSLDSDCKLMYCLCSSEGPVSLWWDHTCLWECRGKLWRGRVNLGLDQVSESRHDHHFFLVCCLLCLHFNHSKPGQLSLIYEQRQ